MIGFGDPSYIVGEGESAISICAVITDGEAAVPVEVLMTGSDGNAQGMHNIILPGLTGRYTL